jgi:predicted glycogen debranching enzyme
MHYASHRPGSGPFHADDESDAAGSGGGPVRGTPGGMRLIGQKSEWGMEPRDQPLITPNAPYRMLGSAALGELVDAEWLLTTGHGGFAMGTALGLPRRKYHTMLNAAARPPVNRVATFLLRERVRIGDGDWVDLFAYDRGENDLVLDTARPLGSFRAGADEVAWTFSVRGPENSRAEVRKTIRVGRGVNTCGVQYKIVTPASQRVELEVIPMLQVRDFHDEQPDTELDEFTFDAAASSLNVTRGEHQLRLAFEGGQYSHDPQIGEPIWLFFEADRGGQPFDRHALPGVLHVTAEDGESREAQVFGALAPDEPDTSLFRGAGPDRARLDAIATHAIRHHPELMRSRELIEASEAYLVTREVNGETLKTVIAGYPWFADWGRDTMISLPGLMLVTGRFQDALACLATFAAHVSEGMIPNLFDDYAGEPQYNTVDASLWFLHAAALYRREADDDAGYQRDLKDAAIEIIDRYQSGTRFGIKMDEDGLIAAGDETTQLTWMDAKRDGQVFTPRHGKAVEINALWHHGLLMTAEAVESTDADKAERLRSLASRVRTSFNDAFTGGPEGGLHDCLLPDGDGGWRPSNELRINQVFAVSLEHSPLERDQAARVVQVVRERLLTPRGVRTLAPDSDRYRPHFEGDMMSRDAAYHNGTAWPWLAGPYAEAELRADGFSDAARHRARAAIQPLLNTMDTGCLGQIAEVFDAEDRPGRGQVEGGCPAQAWSVAETLRLLVMIDG